MAWLESSDAGTVLTLRVVPRARANRVEGVLGEALKIRLCAPPVEGRANKALIRFLSERLRVPAGRITILSGERGRTKRVRVAGVTPAVVRSALGPGG